MIATVTSGNVRVGTLSRRGSTRRFLPDHERHKRFLRMQPVLRLVTDGRLWAVEDVLGDLLAVVRGQAVEDDRTFAGARDELRVDAVAGEVAQALLALGVLAHRRPNVGVEDVGAFDRGTRVGDELA